MTLCTKIPYKTFSRLIAGGQVGPRLSTGGASETLSFPFDRTFIPGLLHSIGKPVKFANTPATEKVRCALRRDIGWQKIVAQLGALHLLNYIRSIGPQGGTAPRVLQLRRSNIPRCNSEGCNVRKTGRKGISNSYTKVWSDKHLAGCATWTRGVTNDV